MNFLSGREWLCVAAGAALFSLNQPLLRIFLHHDHDNLIDNCIENLIKGNELVPHAIVDSLEARSSNGIGNENGAEEKETMQNISIRDGSAPLCCMGARLKPDPLDSSKRKGYLSWDDYFMAIAFLSSQRSKDPNCQVGACLVNRDKVILGIGYNGFPRGCSDDELPWAKVSKTGNPLETKYPYVCHAEVNAILNTNHASAAGQRLYVTMFPCNECAKLIIQAGVAEVVYYIDKIKSVDYAYAASKMLLSMAGVKVWKHKATCRNIILHFQ